MKSKQNSKYSVILSQVCMYGNCCTCVCCRVGFEQEYQKQVDQDIKELKNIGELEHNFDKMTNQISQDRLMEFSGLKQQIVSTLRDSSVYERDEAIRKILVAQINTLKDCKWPPLAIDWLTGSGLFVELKLEM